MVVWAIITITQVVMKPFSTPTFEDKKGSDSNEDYGLYDTRLLEYKSL